ncbi:Lar family restriction alleviation protein [Faecalispora anaeroviscerum]|uniref:Lar family restriction alleviation protein n=1 Tax=Faecalispora anaeroviscerum TaxID=2991836 RepID=UPI0024BB372A|nr:Lar family restriction alleviation protein [Faecalispora anaeroviscerum]
MDKLKPCPFCGGYPTLIHFALTEAIVCKCGANLSKEKPYQEGEYAAHEPTYAVAAQAWNRRVVPENEPLTLHFGNGKVGVSTCRPEDSDTWNELLLWNPKMQQAIGNSIPIKDGTTTDDVEVFARLFFSNAESAQVVVDALNRIIDSCGGNKPLTLEQLRQMDGEPVYKKQLEPDPYGEAIDCWAIVGEVGVNCKGQELICFDNLDFYELMSNYGKTWLAYARKPEQEEQK